MNKHLGKGKTLNSTTVKLFSLKVSSDATGQVTI